MIYRKKIIFAFLYCALFFCNLHFSFIYAQDRVEDQQSALVGNERTPLVAAINANDYTNLEVWVDQELFRQSSPATHLDRVLTVIEAGSGLARGAVFGMLGYDLGNRAHLPEAVSVLFGIGAGLPMVMLGYGKIQELISDIRILIRGEPACVTNLGEDNSKIIKYLLKFCAFSGGIISAPPVAYLGYSKFHPYIDGGAYVIAVPTFYVRTMIDYFAVQALASEFSPYIERLFLSCCSQRKQLEHNIQKKINGSYFQIETFTNAEAIRLQAMLTTDTHQLKLRHLFYPRQSLNIDNIPNESVVYTAALISKVFGQLIGIVGMSVYYPIARASFIPILQSFGIEPTEENLNVLGFISTATLSSLTGYATGNTFKNIFHGVARFVRGQRLESRRYVSPLLGVLVAPWNAIMQTELGFEFLDMREALSVFKICAASIASLATCYWIADNFFSKYIFETFDPRLALLGKLNLISKRLPKMSIETLQRLDLCIEGAHDELSEQ